MIHNNNIENNEFDRIKNIVIYPQTGSNTELHFNLYNINDYLIPQFIYSNNPIDYIKMQINGTEIFSLPLKFCNKLSNFNEDNNTYILPWKLFNMPEIFIANNNHINLITYSNNQHEAKLYCTKIMKHRDIIYNYIQSNHIFVWKSIHKEEIRGSYNRFLLYSRIIFTGFFLDNVDINAIEYLKLTINNNIYLDYDNNMIKFFSEKISNNCYYISFNNTSYKENNYRQYINLNQQENCEIIINSSIHQNFNLYIIHPTTSIIRNNMYYSIDFDTLLFNQLNNNGILLNHKTRDNHVSNNINREESLSTNRFLNSNITPTTSIPRGPNIFSNRSAIPSLSTSTRSVDIIEPYWNNPRYEQVIGRAIRSDSHRTHISETTETRENISETISENISHRIINQGTFINKKLIGDDSCSISLSTIEENNKYMSCDTCNKNFIDTEILKWLEEKNNCPNCRADWENITIYVNIE